MSMAVSLLLKSFGVSMMFVRAVVGQIPHSLGKVLSLSFVDFLVP
jgi:hypothetical protein